MSRPLLLHTCCAPCATVTVDRYRAEGFEPVLFFHNPNIHPYREFRRRLATLEEWAGSQGISLLVHRDYPLESTLRLMLSPGLRCGLCFRERLSATAAEARDRGIGTIGSTLSVSPYQDHGLLLQEARRVETESGVEFAYIDCRQEYPGSVQASRKLGLYRQPYCGCIFSERDRYETPGDAADKTILDTRPRRG